MNWVLVGMKGCGKSTIGEALSILANLPFYDIDNLIEQLHFEKSKTKLHYSEIYRRIGTQQFREFEQKAVDSVTNISNAVIATGGGTLMNATSAKKLKQSGLIIYLHQSEPAFLSKLHANHPICNIEDSSGPYATWQHYYQRRHQVFQQHHHLLFTPNYQSVTTDAKALLHYINKTSQSDQRRP